MLELFQPQTIFFDLFDKLAAEVVVSAERLRTLSRDYPHNKGEIERIREEEHRADDITHEILSRLDRNVQTPIDREDIHALAGDLDNIVDAVDALSKRFTLYHIDSVEGAFVAQTEVLIKAARNVQEAVARLRNGRRLSEVSPNLIEIHRLENVADDNHHAAISQLFDGSHDPLFVLKWRELYELLEAAVDGCEDVGNSIERIILKNG